MQTHEYGVGDSQDIWLCLGMVIGKNTATSVFLPTQWLPRKVGEKTGVKCRVLKERESLWVFFVT
jgi:hypothetical protein